MKNIFIALFLLFAVFGINACAKIPKEAPQLSMLIGEDISAMQSSHRQVVRELFKQLKNQRISYVEHEWTPIFIRKFVRDGRIKEIVNGSIVYNEQEEKFTSPDKAFAEQQLLTSLNGWAGAAIKAIEKKKQELIAPLDTEETEILAAIDSGYTRMIAANSQITGLLTSFRRVELMQDGFIDKLGMGEFRQKITDRLLQASTMAEKGLKTVRKIDAKLQ